MGDTRAHRFDVLPEYLHPVVKLIVERFDEEKEKTEGYIANSTKIKICLNLSEVPVGKVKVDDSFNSVNCNFYILFSAAMDELNKLGYYGYFKIKDDKVILFLLEGFDMVSLNYVQGISGIMEVIAKMEFPSDDLLADEGHIRFITLFDILRDLRPWAREFLDSVEEEN